MSTALASVDPTKTTDHYDLDDGDATHPVYVPYIVPALAGGIIKVTLSWYRKPFRSTVNLNPSSIGPDASGESGHSHNHAHTIPIDGGILPGANDAIGNAGIGGNLFFNHPASTAPTNPNANGSSGHSHNHSHTLTGTGVQSIAEGPTATITALAMDGLDKTNALGGPWSGDMVELDISSLFPKTSGRWHEIAFSLSGLGRVVSLLRIYYTS